MLIAGKANKVANELLKEIGSDEIQDTAETTFKLLICLLPPEKSANSNKVSLEAGFKLLLDYQPKNLRQSIPVVYEKFNQINSVTVRYQIKIGGAVFIGHPRQCTIEAKGSAANEALAALSVFDNNEEELRKRLGLEQRIFLRQADNIRDQLRVIKQRSKNLTPVSKSAVIHSIVDVYTILYFIEASFAREEKSHT